MSKESIPIFEQRKQSHIEWAQKPQAQSRLSSGLEQVRIEHEALPDFNLSDVDLKCALFTESTATPFLVSSMTAGHVQGWKINQNLALAAAHRGWVMAVGSQRRELYDPTAHKEWLQVRQKAPQLVLIGNIGIAQVIQESPERLAQMMSDMGARALFVHLNPLQEALQVEGTPHFKGAWKALETLVKGFPLPVLVKEVGCGISKSTIRRLLDIGIQAVDVAGMGGTHWGLIEGLRAQGDSNQAWRYAASLSFQDWGIPLLDNMLEVKELKDSCQIWASGGVRSGVDAAKLWILGARRIGMAQKLLTAAQLGAEAVEAQMAQVEYELKVAMFCAGAQNLQELSQKRLWSIKASFGPQNLGGGIL